MKRRLIVQFFVFVIILVLGIVSVSAEDETPEPNENNIEEIGETDSQSEKEEEELTDPDNQNAGIESSSQEKTEIVIENSSESLIFSESLPDKSSETLLFAAKPEGWTEDKTQFIIGYEEDGITPKLASGFYQIDDKIYYFDPENENKTVVNESREIEGKYYFFKEDGSMLKGGWNADKTRFHDQDGSAVTGFHKIGNYRYRFDESTAEITRGWMEIQPGVKAFFDGSGRMSFGFNKIGNYYYYFDTNGGIIYGDHKIGAYYYHFDEVTGRRYSGFRTVSGKTYFYDPNGHICFGQHKIGAYYYRFGASGVMTTGWFTDGSVTKTYYYDNNGHLALGYKTVNGHLHLFDTKTGLWNISYWLKSQSRPYYIKVNRAANTVTVYAKYYDGKYSYPYKAMICSTGTATPLGKYNTFGRSRWRALYGGVYGQYATDIVGDILFHSVPYSATRVNSLYYWKYNQLGTAASMGCVRLTVIDAKWIYDNCPIGTTVEFYDNKNNPGPLGKPKAQKLSNNSKGYWDPTDPASGNPWH